MRYSHCCSMLHLFIVAQNSFGKNGETELPIFSGGILRIPFGQLSTDPCFYCSSPVRGQRLGGGEMLST